MLTSYFVFDVLSSLFIIRSNKGMKLTSSSVTIIFWTIVLLVVARPSHQYVYSCNPSASCGCSSSPASLSRIVGGESAGTNTWSWAVSLSISGTSLCSGSIISSFWVITAAHCVSGVAPSKVTVYAGSNVRFSGQSRVGSKIVVHPNYDSSTKVNDIALIQLNTPLSMSGSIKSICIPSVSSARLAAGEWPSVGLYVCYILFSFFFQINNRYYSIGCGCRMGSIIGRWFTTNSSSTSNS